MSKYKRNYGKQRYEQGEHDHLLQEVLEAADDEGGHQSAGEVTQQPRKAILEGIPRRPLRRAVHADQLKDVVIRPAREIDHFVGEQADVDHAQELALRVHHRKRQEPSRGEVLAGDQNRRPIRNGHDVIDHHLGDRPVWLGGQQPPGGHDAHQPLLGVDHVEVMDGVGGGRRADDPKHLIDGLARGKNDLRRPSQRKDGLVQLGGGQLGGRHPLTIFGFRPDPAFSKRRSRASDLLP